MKSPIPLCRIVGTISSSTGLRCIAQKPSLLRDVDLVEIRLDSLPASRRDTALDLCRRLERRGIQTLATIRLRKEGGSWDADDKARLALYLRALSACSYVDVECQSSIVSKIVRAAHSQHRKVILSYHAFQATPLPSKLRSIARQARRQGADIIKIACMTRHISDHIKLLDLLRHSTERRLCVIGMGHASPSLRIHLPALGSCLAYGYLDLPAAPGQLSCHKLREILNWVSPGLLCPH